MSEPLVDVVLPTHERPHTLRYAVQAVLRQSVERLSLHVVCDGSVPGTEEALSGLADPRLHLHRLPKAPGYGYANRNTVLRRTSAPIVAYAADDDLWFPDHLARALAELETLRGGMVAFRSCLVKFPDRLDPFFFASDWQSRFSRTLLRNWFIGAAPVVHERSVLDTVGGWDERLLRFGDRDFYNRARRRVPSRYLNEVTVLRFFAMHWDRRYARLPRAPQHVYLERLGDPAWRATVRAEASSAARSASVRREQLRDFLHFALRSGPRFARYWVHRLVASAGGAS